MKKLHSALVLISLALMAAALATQWKKLPASGLDLAPGAFALASGLLLLLFVMDAYGWHLILKAIGTPLPYQRSIRIWMLSSVTRYLPGGIWPYASRAGMARAEGVSLAAGSFSLYLETLLVTASSLAVGLPAVFSAVGLPFSPFAAVFTWLFFSVLIHPRILGLIHYLPGRIGRAFSLVPIPDLWLLLGLYLYYLFFWGLFGLTFSLFVHALFPLGMEHWLVVGSSFALAFCVGFIVIIFPSGIGIRESLLFLLLSGILPTASGVVVAIGSRLWLTAGEIICLGVVVLWTSSRRAAPKLDSK